MKSVAALRENLAKRDLLGLVEDLAKRHGALVDEVLACNREPRVCRARQAAWYALRHHGEVEWSYPAIGRLFDRDHTTVMAGVRAYERWLATRRGDGDAVAAE